MSDELQVNLVEQIRAAHTEATAIAEQAKGFASEAVAKAIECGRLLIQQKAALGHGSWIEWRAEHIPEISHNTVSKYMRLAKVAADGLPEAESTEDSNFTHGLNLRDSASARQAYIAAGVLPAPAPKEPQRPKPDKPPVSYVRWVNGLRFWYNKRMEEEPLETWPENARRVLKNDIRWIAELYDRL